MVDDLDGVERPVGWVYAVDLLDYFGTPTDGPRWLHAKFADEATLYRSREHANEIVERMGDRWPEATIVDIDTAPVVYLDAASPEDIEQANVVALLPGTRFTEPLRNESAPNPATEGPVPGSPGVGAVNDVSSSREEEPETHGPRRPSGLDAIAAAYDTVRDLTAYELAADLMRERSPQRATEFESTLAEARELLNGPPGMLTLLSAEAAAELDRIAPATLDAGVQAALGQNVKTIVDKLRAEAGPAALDAAVGGAVLAAVDRIVDAAGPDRWPNVGTEHDRAPLAALADADRALAEVNRLLDRAGQTPSAAGEDLVPPPRGPAPGHGPDIGGP